MFLCYIFLNIYHPTNATENSRMNNLSKVIGLSRNPNNAPYKQSSMNVLDFIIYRFNTQQSEMLPNTIKPVNRYITTHNTVILSAFFIWLVVFVMRFVIFNVPVNVAFVFYGLDDNSDYNECCD